MRPLKAISLYIWVYEENLELSILNGIPKKSAELSKKVMSNEIHGMREHYILHLLKIECEKN